MTRLFLSLYAFITITLIVLSAVLEHVFFDDSEQTTVQQHLVKSIISLHKAGHLDIAQINTLGLQGRVIPLRDIPWTQSDLIKLTNKEPVVLFDNNGGTKQYIKVNQHTLIEIDLPSTVIQQPRVYWYSILFFVLLAIGIAIWLWPLWRDLQKLDNTAQQTNFEQDFSPINLDKRSLVYSIGQSLDELNQKVRQLIKTQMELTGAVAHEFRTPLARLKFELEALNIADKKSLSAVNQDITELEKLMHEMLSYTSLESQQPELNITQIPLLSLCKQRIKANQTQQNNELNISLTGSNLTILADEHFIQRMVDNLLQNALRHATSQIEISVTEGINQTIFSVEDNGPGISPAHRDKIFQPFYRPDNSRNRTRGGAGLGLAIVHRIAKWHNADCWVDDSHLGGAKFCCAFSTSSQCKQQIHNQI